MQKSTYWELNTFQKAALGYEEIQAFRKVELMIKGVAFPQEPEISENPPSFHEFAKGHETMATVVKFGYSNEFQISDDDREKLLSINFNQVLSNYINGESISYISSGTKPEIKNVVVYPAYSTLYEKYTQMYGDAVKRKAEWERYQKDVMEAGKATSELIDDWNEAQERVRTYELVKRVFDEYLTMTNGDNELATSFLEKRFDYEEMETFKRLSQEKGGD